MPQITKYQNEYQSINLNFDKSSGRNSSLKNRKRYSSQLRNKSPSLPPLEQRLVKDKKFTEHTLETVGERKESIGDHSLADFRIIRVAKKKQDLENSKLDRLRENRAQSTLAHHQLSCTTLPRSIFLKSVVSTHLQNRLSKECESKGLYQSTNATNTSSRATLPPAKLGLNYESLNVYGDTT